MFKTKKLKFATEQGYAEHFQNKTLENLRQTYNGVNHLIESKSTHVNIFSATIDELNAAISFIVDNENAIEVLEDLLKNSLEYEEYEFSRKIQNLIDKINDSKSTT